MERKKTYEKCVVQAICFSDESLIITSGGMDGFTGEEQEFTWDTTT